MFFRKKKDEPAAPVALSDELLNDVRLYVEKRFIPKPKQEVHYRRFIPARQTEGEPKKGDEPTFSLADEPIILREPEVYYQGFAEPEAPAVNEIDAILDRKLNNLDEPFMTTLFRIIDSKGLSDAAVYKKANIDRRLFSKMRRKRTYIPSFRTAAAFAIALELNLEQTENLLRRAGYALSSSKKFDVIIEYFITSGRYDVYEINAALLRYDQPLLGA